MLQKYYWVQIVGNLIMNTLFEHF